MMRRFDYGAYEKLMRRKWTEAHHRYARSFVPIFSECRNVLDLGCGEGVFMDELRAAGIPAVGIDCEPSSVSVAKAKGLDIRQEEVVSFLNECTDVFDGVFCSHLVEHLHFDAVVDLIEGVTNCIQAPGLVVFVFPNSRSLQMQLFSFWRDPTHVRPYDRDLIVAVMAHYGLKIQDSVTSYWPNEAAHKKLAVGPALNRVQRRMTSRLSRLNAYRVLAGVVERSWLGKPRRWISRINAEGNDVCIVARKETG